MIKRLFDICITYFRKNSNCALNILTLKLNIYASFQKRYSETFIVG